jgi:hypothetical protein
LPVPQPGFAWTRGAERVRHYALPAPRRYATDFCEQCGSPVPRMRRGSSLAMLPAGAVDTPLPRLPTVHLYTGSSAPWYEITASGEQFDELPPPERLRELLR